MFSEWCYHPPNSYHLSNRKTELPLNSLCSPDSSFLSHTSNKIIQDIIFPIGTRQQHSCWLSNSIICLELSLCMNCSLAGFHFHPSLCLLFSLPESSFASSIHLIHFSVCLPGINLVNVPFRKAFPNSQH